MQHVRVGENLIIVILLIATMASSTLFTLFLYHISPRLGLLDHPIDRSIHLKPVANSGGVALLLTFLLFYFGSYAFFGTFCGLSIEDSKSFAAGIILFGAIGFCDDRFGMVASKKLALQTVAAMVVLYLSPAPTEVSVTFVGLLQIAPWQGAIVSFLWILFVVNAINLIDGLDGLLAVFSIIFFITIAVIDYLFFHMGLVDIALFWAGAVAGFLVYNKPKAKIFLGNSGSNLLGFMIAILPLAGRFKIVSVVTFLPVLILMLYPLIDLSFAFFRRIKELRSPFKGDCYHFHHLHFRVENNSWKTLGFFSLMFLLNGIMTIIICSYQDIALILFSVTLIINVVFLWSVVNKFIDAFPALSRQVNLFALPFSKKLGINDGENLRPGRAVKLKEEIETGCMTSPE